jgi:exopolysaccharide biosynthesis polyprenyl glycosylphosphotransferase
MSTVTVARQQEQAEQGTSPGFGQAQRRRLMVVGADAAALAAGAAVASALSGSLAPALWVTVTYAVFTWVWMVAAQLYNSRLVTDRQVELPRVAQSCVRGLLSAGVVLAVAAEPVDTRAALLLLGATTVSLSIERELVRAWFASKRKSGQALWSSVLVCRTGDAAELRTSIDANGSTPHVIRDHVDPTTCADAEALLTQTLARVRASEARGVVIDEGSLERAVANRFVRGLLEANLFVDMSSPLSDISTERLASRNLGPSVATFIAPRPRDGWRAHAKRTFDVTLTLAGLLALAPVMIALAVAVKATSKGPVLFRQERVGRNGEPFKMLKFRSMVVNAEELLAQLEAENEGAGPLFKMKHDPRITAVGRFIRKTSLDELPQLFNVLKDEMSLVGPRPALRSEMSEWDSDLYGRLQVKPGITGMWQVSGRSSTTFDEYSRLDLYYVHNWSLFVDLSILARTIPAVVKSDGAY